MERKQKTVLTTNEVAQILGTHPAHVRKLCAQGDLPAIRIGRKWYIPVKKLDELFGAEIA